MAKIWENNRTEEIGFVTPHLTCNLYLHVPALKLGVQHGANISKKMIWASTSWIGLIHWTVYLGHPNAMKARVLICIYEP